MGYFLLGLCFYSAKDRWVGINEMPAIYRPVDQDGFANDITFGDEAPITRIITHQPIVTHYEVVTGWNYQPTPSRVGWQTNIRLSQQYAVYRYCCTISNDDISRYAYHALNQIFGGINGPIKDDDITTFGCMKEIG